MKIEGCNAELNMRRAYYLLSANLEEDLPKFVEIAIKIAGHTIPKRLPIDQFDPQGLKKQCPFLHFRNRKAQAEFQEAMISNLMSGLKSGAIERGYYIETTGAITYPDGRVWFQRGSESIGGGNRPLMLAPEISHMHLLESDKPLVSCLPSLLWSSPLQVLLVFAYVILTSIRSLLMESKVDLQAVLYIVGGQGLGKTTLATRIAGIYETDGKPIGIVQAGSTHAAVNQLMLSLCDQPVVIDDLCLSASRATARTRVDLASKLIRQGTGDIPITKKVGNQTVELPCKAGLIMTAEFHLENLSDLTRCLIVPVQRPLDIPAELTSDQIGEAVRHYSRWFAEHSYTEITRFRDAISKKGDHTMDTRMSTNYTCLKIAFQSFLCSLRELGLPPCQEHDLLEKMDDALSEAQQCHQEMIKELQGRIPVGNLSYCILEGYHAGAFDLAKKIDKLPKHAGILWKKDLCLRPDSLIQYVRLQAGYQDWSSNKITRALKDIGALVLQEAGTATVYLTKNPPRVYRIRLDILKANAKKY